MTRLVVSSLSPSISASSLRVSGIEDFSVEMFGTLVFTTHDAMIDRALVTTHEIRCPLLKYLYGVHRFIQ